MNPLKLQKKFNLPLVTMKRQPVLPQTIGEVKEVEDKLAYATLKENAMADEMVVITTEALKKVGLGVLVIPEERDPYERPILALKGISKVRIIEEKDDIVEVQILPEDTPIDSSKLEQMDVTRGWLYDYLLSTPLKGITLSIIPQDIESCEMKWESLINYSALYLIHNNALKELILEMNDNYSKLKVIEWVLMTHKAELVDHEQTAYKLRQFFIPEERFNMTAQ